MPSSPVMGLGFQLGAADMEEASVGEDAYMEGIDAGLDQMGAARHAARKIMKHRQQRRMCVQTPNGWMPMGRGGGGGGGRQLTLRSPLAFKGDEDEIGGDDDELDENDDAELGAIDEEIGEIDDDSDEVGGTSPDEIGASISKTAKKIDKFQALLSKLEAKYESTPVRRRLKRKHLLNRINRVKVRLAKREQKLENKQEKLAAKLGIPVAALAAGGAGAAALGITRSRQAQVEEQMNRQSVDAGLGQRSIWQQQPPDGEFEPIPFQIGGSSIAIITKGAGAAGTQPISMTSATVTYADFEVMGIDIQVIVQGGDAIDILPNVTLDSWIVAGGLTQVYAPVPIGLGGTSSMSTVRAGPIVSTRRFYTIRQDHARLNRLNTATLSATFVQSIANAASIYATFSAVLLCRRINDDGVSAMRGR